ncbi:conserved hypothetical protein [Ricinus communis]|uniref:Uncharacterized protein n=1 Tax=Ricinus communis TaxID=3988 RepID=B9SG64_RICCO|nr:conserved hypothetical protein [Ricinus communis]
MTTANKSSYTQTRQWPTTPATASCCWVSTSAAAIDASMANDTSSCYKRIMVTTATRSRPLLLPQTRHGFATAGSPAAAVAGSLMLLLGRFNNG